MDRRLASVLLLAAGISGCVATPDPGMQRYTPEINGAVTMDGVPVEGARVTYHRILQTGRCATSKDQTLTDANGKFHIPHRDVFRFWQSMGDPINVWGICISGPEGEVMGWRGEGLGYPPTQATFSCELSAAASESKQGNSVCVRHN